MVGGLAAAVSAGSGVGFGATGLTGRLGGPMSVGRLVDAEDISDACSTVFSTDGLDVDFGNSGGRLASELIDIQTSSRENLPTVIDKT